MKEAAFMSAHQWFPALGFLILAGCTGPVRQHVDNFVCERANLGHDVRTAADIEAEKNAKKQKQEDKAVEQKPKTLQQRLPVPASVPGADAPKVQMPNIEPRAKAIE